MVAPTLQCNTIWVYMRDQQACTLFAKAVNVWKTPLYSREGGSPVLGPRHRGDTRRRANLRPHPRPRYGATPWSGSHRSAGAAPDCQNTSIGIPPRGYQ